MVMQTNPTYLDKATAQAIADRTRKTSLVTALGTQIPLAPGGTDVPVFDTSGITGNFVGEAEQKPTGEASRTNLHMVKRKWAVILPFSNEMVRDDKSGVVEAAREAAAGALARAIDRLAFDGAGLSGQTYINQTDQVVSLSQHTPAEGGVFASLNDALKVLVEGGHDLTGFVMDNESEPIINGAVDTSGRPIFIESPLDETNPAVRSGRLLGRPARMARDVASGTTPNRIVGYAGDFASIRWGILSGLSEDVDTRSAVHLDMGNGPELVSAYERNLTLFRYEAEVGVLVPDPDAFVKLVDGEGAPLE